MSIPVMPVWFRPVGWDGKPVDDSARRRMWLRENGYEGFIGVDGNPLPVPRQRSGEDAP